MEAANMNCRSCCIDHVQHIRWNCQSAAFYLGVLKARYPSLFGSIRACPISACLVFVSISGAAL